MCGSAGCQSSMNQSPALLLAPAVCMWRALNCPWSQSHWCQHLLLLMSRWLLTSASAISVWTSGPLLARVAKNCEWLHGLDMSYWNTIHSWWFEYTLVALLLHMLIPKYVMFLVHLVSALIFQFLWVPGTWQLLPFYLEACPAQLYDQHLKVVLFWLWVNQPTEEVNELSPLILERFMEDEPKTFWLWTLILECYLHMSFISAPSVPPGFVSYFCARYIQYIK